MKLTFAIALLGLAIPVMGQSAPSDRTSLENKPDVPAQTEQPKAAPAAPEPPKPVLPAPPTQPAGMPLSQQEQLELRLAAAKAQVKTFKSQLKQTKKGSSNSLDKLLSKIRKDHGWDDTVQIQDRGNTIVGVKQ